MYSVLATGSSKVRHSCSYYSSLRCHSICEYSTQQLCLGGTTVLFRADNRKHQARVNFCSVFIFLLEDVCTLLVTTDRTYNFIFKPLLSIQSKLNNGFQPGCAITGSNRSSCTWQNPQLINCKQSKYSPNFQSSFCLQTGTPSPQSLFQEGKRPSYSSLMSWLYPTPKAHCQNPAVLNLPPHNYHTNLQNQIPASPAITSSVWTTNLLDPLLPLPPWR